MIGWLFQFSELHGIPFYESSVLADSESVTEVLLKEVVIN